MGSPGSRSQSGGAPHPGPDDPGSGRGFSHGDIRPGGIRASEPGGHQRFVGSVACLQRDAAGLVQLSGGVRQGETTAGEPLTGKDFAFTLDTAAHPQRFSSPRFANRGTIPPCGRWASRERPRDAGHVPYRAAVRGAPAVEASGATDGRM